MIPDELLALYRRMIETVPPPNYVARNMVYLALRHNLEDFWEARNTRLIKETLDQIDTAVAGRDTGDDWRTHGA